jgi:hypothetical protein
LDNGYLIEDYTTEKKISLDTWREMLSNYGDNIFELNFQASPYQYNFTFTYKKIQEVIADIGGFVDMIMFTLMYLMAPLVDADYH